MIHNHPTARGLGLTLCISYYNYYTVISGAEHRMVGQVRGGSCHWAKILLLIQGLLWGRRFREGIWQLNGSCWNMHCLPFLQRLLSAKCLRGTESTSASDVHICQKASSSVYVPKADRWPVIPSWNLCRLLFVHKNNMVSRELIWLMYGIRLPIRFPLKHKANH